MSMSWYMANVEYLFLNFNPKALIITVADAILCDIFLHFGIKKTEL